MLQAALKAMPGACSYKVVCEPCVKAVHIGVSAATAACKVNARVHALMLAALEDTPPEDVVWMPAHKGASQVGKLFCGNGVPLTALDLKGNALADKLAKRAVKQHRVDSSDVAAWSKLCDDTRSMAMWIARATHLANNAEAYPFKDSEASRSKAEAAKHKTAIQQRAKDRAGPVRKVARLHTQGGHRIVREMTWGRKGASEGRLIKLRTGWRCTQCRAPSSNKAAFEKFHPS